MCTPTSGCVDRGGNWEHEPNHDAIKKKVISLTSCIRDTFHPRFQEFISFIAMANSHITSSGLHCSNHTPLKIGQSSILYTFGREQWWIVLCLLSRQLRCLRLLNNTLDISAPIVGLLKLVNVLLCSMWSSSIQVSYTLDVCWFLLWPKEIVGEYILQCKSIKIHLHEVMAKLSFTVWQHKAVILTSSELCDLGWCSQQDYSVLASLTLSTKGNPPHPAFFPCMLTRDPG